MLVSRISRVLVLTLLSCALVGAVGAAGAAAAQRYASPTGASSGFCTANAPCSLEWAVEKAFAGDEVLVKPGDYSLSSTLEDPYQITIHGIAGQARPQLSFSGAGQDGVRLTHGSSLQYVEIEQKANSLAVFAADSSVIDRAIARASGGDATAMVQNATIRNSIVVSSGTGGTAVETTVNGANTTSNYRHLTAIATGSGGVAIKVQALSFGHATVNASNVIARGGGGGASIKASTDNTGQALVNINYSNFGASGPSGAGAAIAEGNHIQHLLPAFVDAADGNYHQAPGSVTVDAGVDDVFTGNLDVDGQLRAMGTPDIGADELSPAPAVETGSASSVGADSAELAGSVNPHGANATYHFDYGPTAAYGSASPSAGTGAGYGTAGVAASLTGLTPGTTYHYRLVASNEGGLTAGEDRTFTTASEPTTAGGGGTSTTGSTPTSPFAGVSLASTRLRFARRAVTVTLRCPAATIGGCAGRTKLTARRVRLGRAGFSIAPGRQARVKVRMTRAGRRLLGRVPKLAAKSANAAHDGAGQAKTSAVRVTIRRPR
jgi:hypothetical protein